MSIFKRITTTLTASVDNLVDQVENHDAVVEASIKKVRQAAADTRVRLGRLQKDGQRLNNRIKQHKADIEQWQQRAVNTASDNQEKALQCLQRKKQLQAELELLEQNQQSHKATERQVTDNLRKIESRISELSLQRNSFRSRESAARANQVMQRIEGDSGTSLDDTFDRWEATLITTEIGTPMIEIEDSLASDFIESEQRQELEAELQELVGKQEAKQND